MKVPALSVKKIKYFKDVRRLHFEAIEKGGTRERAPQRIMMLTFDGELSANKNRIIVRTDVKRSILDCKDTLDGFIVLIAMFCFFYIVSFFSFLFSAL